LPPRSARITCFDQRGGIDKDDLVRAADVDRRSGLGSSVDGSTIGSGARRQPPPLAWSDHEHDAGRSADVPRRFGPCVHVPGSVPEGVPAIVLFGPLLFPIARQLGIHEVHYAIVVILAMGLGLFAPPLGVGYYAACAIGRVNPDKRIRPIFGYLIALLIGIAIVAAFPWLSVDFYSRSFRRYGHI
jgi:hypothetical protein